MTASVFSYIITIYFISTMTCKIIIMTNLPIDKNQGQWTL